jgi:hypothetical protein
MAIKYTKIFHSKALKYTQIGFFVYKYTIWHAHNCRYLAKKLAYVHAKVTNALLFSIFSLNCICTYRTIQHM